MEPAELAIPCLWDRDYELPKAKSGDRWNSLRLTVVDGLLLKRSERRRQSGHSSPTTGPSLGRSPRKETRRPGGTGPLLAHQRRVCTSPQCWCPVVDLSTTRRSQDRLKQAQCSHWRLKLPGDTSASPIAAVLQVPIATSSQLRCISRKPVYATTRSQENGSLMRIFGTLPHYPNSGASAKN